MAVLAGIPAGFVDDGCSNSPDAWFRFDFRWACRIHDWRYCSRCHPAREMTQAGRTRADQELGMNIRAALPWRWRWVASIYQFEVWRWGGMAAWDSCGPEAGNRCRHGMPERPEWLGIEG